MLGVFAGLILHQLPSRKLYWQTNSAEDHKTEPQLDSAKHDCLQSVKADAEKQRVKL